MDIPVLCTSQLAQELSSLEIWMSVCVLCQPAAVTSCRIVTAPLWAAAAVIISGHVGPQVACTRFCDPQLVSVQIFYCLVLVLSV